MHPSTSVQAALGLVILLSAPLGACGRGDKGDVETRTPAPVVEEERGDTFEPARYWALKQVFTTLVVLPVVGETKMSAQSQNYYIVEMDRDGETLYQVEDYCWSDFEEVAGMRTYLPDAFYDSLEPTTRVATLSEAAVGARYLAPDSLTIYGAELDDPWNDVLPTDMDDARLIDQEGDGALGFTAVVTGWMGDADVYMAQRTITTMTGTILSADRIEGSLSNSLEQNILDATTWWASLDGFESVPSGVPEQNFWIMVALDGPMSCETLKGEYETLF